MRRVTVDVKCDDFAGELSIGRTPPPAEFVGPQDFGIIAVWAFSRNDEEVVDIYASRFVAARYGGEAEVAVGKVLFEGEFTAE